MAIQLRRIDVDEGTWQGLEDLCEEMINTNGIVANLLELALADDGETRTRYLMRAKALAEQGTRSLKRFLWRWAELREFSERSNDEASEIDVEAIQLLTELLVTFPRWQALADELKIGAPLRDSGL